MTLAPRKEPFRVSLGDRGEMIAWDYLIRRGYRILEKNYRCKIGEIDVVAEKNKRLVFVEIKTRRHAGFGRPEEAVDAAKQRKLTRLAQWYLKEKKKKEVSVFFDVLAITWNSLQEPQMRLIENAFSVDAFLT